MGASPEPFSVSEALPSSVLSVASVAVALAAFSRAFKASFGSASVAVSVVPPLDEASEVPLPVPTPNLSDIKICL